MILGVDFDNTIVCYDSLFHKLARERGLIPADVPPSKGAVREYLRQSGQEPLWTELQGYAYGPGMAEAVPFPGVETFFRRCRERGVSVFIISHRTHRPFAGPAYDLHQAARDWLNARGFLAPDGIGLCADRVCFEVTLQDKLERIREKRCSHFIDDLPECLAEPDFPAGVQKILFDPNGRESPLADVWRADSWKALETLLLAHVP